MNSKIKKKIQLKSIKIDLIYIKKNPKTTFIQLSRTKKIKNKYNAKKKTLKKKKKEKSNFDVIASEVEKRKKNKSIKYVN